MKTTPLSSLLPLMHLPRCPDPVKLQALRTAFRRFCIETEAWRYADSSQTTAIGDSSYTISGLPENVMLLRIASIEKNDNLIHPSQWKAVYPDGIEFITAPTIAGEAFTINCVLIPSIECDSAESTILTRFGHTIAYGAMSEAKLDPGSASDPVPWFDQNGAMLYENRFMDGVADAKTDVLTNKQTGQVSVQHEGFYL